MKEIDGVLDNVSRLFSTQIKPLVECFQEPYIDEEKKNEKDEEIKKIRESMKKDIKNAVKQFNNELENVIANFAENLAKSFKAREEIKKLSKIRCECKLGARAINELIDNEFYAIYQEKIRIVCSKCRKCLKQKEISSVLNKDGIKRLNKMGIKFKSLTCEKCKGGKANIISCGCVLCTPCICKSIAMKVNTLGKEKGSIEFECPVDKRELPLKSIYDGIDNKEYLFNILRVASLYNLGSKSKVFELCCIECFKNFEPKNFDPKKDHTKDKMYCKDCPRKKDNSV